MARYRIMKSFVVLTLALGMSACFSVGVVTRSVAPAESHNRWMHGFFWGLVGSEIDSESACGGRPVARVDTYMSLGNMVLYALSSGIYSPMSVMVTCGYAPEPRVYAPPPPSYAPAPDVQLEPAR